MTELEDLIAELCAEQDAIDEIVAPLSDEQWQRPTPSPGWTVADQIGHLTYFDDSATAAIEDAEAFQASLEALLASGDMEVATLHRHLSPAELLDAWRGGRKRLAKAAAGLDPSARVPWYGPSMGAKSFVTARLMECWAHGQDIVDALGADRVATDRLRHIVRLGFITRGWSYSNRGLEAPAAEVRLELTTPSGETWRFGPDGAVSAVIGSALDFCLVVTQRRNVEDTELVTTGDAARDWMHKAQAFAGPATDGPAPRRA